jgi:hypothetical protein
MAEENAIKAEERFFGTFVKSYSRLYAQWKRKDIISVALQTLPKQVKKEKVIDNLQKLESDYNKTLHYPRAQNTDLKNRIQTVERKFLDVEKTIQEIKKEISRANHYWQ